MVDSSKIGILHHWVIGFRLNYFIVFLMLVCGCGNRNYQCQLPEPSNDKRVLDARVSLNLQSASMYEAAVALRMQGVRVCIQRFPETPSLKSINVDLSHTTVRHVLNSLVEQDPRYCWHLADNAIVGITCCNSTIDEEIRLSRSDKSYREIIENQQLDGLKIRVSTEGLWRPDKPEDELLGLGPLPVSVRELLNDVAANEEDSVWTFGRVRDNYWEVNFSQTFCTLPLKNSTSDK